MIGTPDHYGTIDVTVELHESDPGIFLAAGLCQPSSPSRLIAVNSAFSAQR